MNHPVYQARYTTVKAGAEVMFCPCITQVCRIESRPAPSNMSNVFVFSEALNRCLQVGHDQIVFTSQFICYPTKEAIIVRDTEGLIK